MSDEEVREGRHAPAAGRQFLGRRSSADSDAARFMVLDGHDTGGCWGCLTSSLKDRNNCFYRFTPMPSSTDILLHVTTEKPFKETIQVVYVNFAIPY